LAVPVLSMSTHESIQGPSPSSEALNSLTRRGNCPKCRAQTYCTIDTPAGTSERSVNSRTPGGLLRYRPSLSPVVLRPVGPRIAPAIRQQGIEPRIHEDRQDGVGDQPITRVPEADPKDPRRRLLADARLHLRELELLHYWLSCTLGLESLVLEPRKPQLTGRSLQRGDARPAHVLGGSRRASRCCGAASRFGGAPFGHDQRDARYHDSDERGKRGYIVGPQRVARYSHDAKLPCGYACWESLPRRHPTRSVRRGGDTRRRRRSATPDTFPQRFHRA